MRDPEWDDFVYFAKLFGMGVLIVLLVAAPVAGIVGLYNFGTCQTLAQLDHQHVYQWRFFGGCLVELDSGRWINTEYIGYFEGSLRIIP